MMLLDFPIELIQLILQCASTPSYLQAAVSCRTLFRIASTCREVVLHHLYQLPGLTVGLESHETKFLFHLLRVRAAEQLYGANFHANRILYAFPERRIDIRASSVARGKTPNVALVFKGDDAVHLFHASSDLITRIGSLRIPYEQPGVVEVLRTAFIPSNEGIFALMRFTPEVEEGLDISHPFIKEAAESTPRPDIHLVYYPLLESADSEVSLCTFPEYHDFEPLLLAVGSKDKFAICWRHLYDRGQHEVVVYNLIKGLFEESPPAGFPRLLRYSSRIVIDEDGLWIDSGDTRDKLAKEEGSCNRHPPITDLMFNDMGKQLLYSYQACTLYRFYQDLPDTPYAAGTWSVHFNSCRVRFLDNQFLPFSIGIPFFGTHDTYAVAPDREMCHWKYLSFGIATQREENWTVACLLRSEARCRATRCNHIMNRERGRRFEDWTVVARLWGYRKSTNSLGCIVTASENGTRLAVANWDWIYIWVLNPVELAEDNSNGFYPASFQSADSVTIELRPIVLHLNAVCFKMFFTDKENELCALTDRGLLCWDLDPHGTGARIIHETKIP